MPLIALDSTDSRVVDATYAADGVWALYWRARTGDRLRCRGCGEVVHAKTMTQSGLRFFAHSSTVKGCPSHGETARHLELKKRVADAFRAAGWDAELEVAGEGWRADVLVAGPTGRQVAVEVQLAGTTAEEVDDRMSRHSRSGLTTMWIVERRRPYWAERFPTVVVDNEDRVIDSVLVTSATRVSVPAPAAPASLSRFVARWAEGRLTPVDDDEAWKRYLHHSVTAYFELDGCASAFLKRYLAERAAMEARHRELAAAREVARALREMPMLASLEAFAAWFSQFEQWKCWYGGGYRRDWRAAVSGTWKTDAGVVITIGRGEPMWVLALAEPHEPSPRRDPRVAAWVSGHDPATNTAGFDLVLRPSSALDLAELDLKGLSRRSRRPVPRSWR